ncbi:MAG: hypothetical protein Q7T61_15510 [Caulobacter sp.]|nr:hypothetical protein [Caulobacter sp.]
MRAWKAVFAVAALFNFAVGLPLLIAPAAFYAMLGQTAPDILNAQLAGGLIAVFGIGYAMVARDPAANRGIIVLGVIGKAPLPLLYWLNVQAGRAPMSGFPLTLVDLAFALLFLTYLLRTPR